MLVTMQPVDSNRKLSNLDYALISMFTIVTARLTCSH